MLTVNDLSCSWASRRGLSRLIKSGAIKAVKLGGNSWRVRPEEWTRFVEKGATGFRHARPSGGIRPGMFGHTGGGTDENAGGFYAQGAE
jgi:hypothetical protein